jgi:tripeptidyl-peptidase-1
MVSVTFTSTFLLFVALATAKPTATNLVQHESREHAPAGWVSTGAASASTKINMRVALPSKNFAGLEKVLYEVSTPTNAKYGQHLTPEEVGLHSLSLS